MRVAPALALVGMLSACASGGGVAYPEFAATAPAVSTDSIRLVVLRAADTPQYSVRSASLRLDDSDVGGLAPGAYKAFTVTPGTHRFVVDMWDVPGRCELTLEVAGGGEHFFEVSPRGANAIATLPMVLVPVSSLGGLLTSGALMMGGLAAESAGKQCGGAFSIVELERPAAIAKLAPLRASK
jgi:hypothetical protein